MKNKIIIFTILFFSAIVFIFPIDVLAADNIKLVKSQNNPKVYRIVNNKKFWISNEKIFISYGYNWHDIKIVSQSEIDKYERIKHVKESDKPTVYYLTENGLKRAVINEEVFLSYNNSWSDIAIINKTELEFYPENFLIKGQDSRVYKIEEWTKKYIPSPEIFNYHKYSWQDVALVNNVELESYKTGLSLSMPSGSASPISTDDKEQLSVEMGLKTDQDIYYSSQQIILTINLKSNKNISDLKLSAVGVVSAFGYNFFKKEAQVDLVANQSKNIEFTSVLPACNSCSGVNPGNYSISVNILSDSQTLKTNAVNFELRQ